MKNFIQVFIVVATSISCSSRFYDSKSDIYNQKTIVDAYFKHRNEEKKFPDDLGEMVDKGHLPKYGDFYSGYWDLSIFPRKISYRDSDYKIFNGSGGDRNKIIGIRSLNDPDRWEFRGDIINYVSDKRKNLNH
jgi:hypothetical protein